MFNGGGGCGCNDGGGRVADGDNSTCKFIDEVPINQI